MKIAAASVLNGETRIGKVKKEIYRPSPKNYRSTTISHLKIVDQEYWFKGLQFFFKVRIGLLFF